MNTLPSPLPALANPANPVSGNLDRLRRLAEGEWDLTLRMEEQAASQAPGLINRILEGFGEALTKSTRFGMNLYANVPKLFQLAENLEAASQTQAGHASQIAQSTRAMAKNLHELTGSVERALGFTERVGEIVAQLETGSRQIEEVLDLVRRIADQTKLISLNASVEAARAGVHGRAFAVVAEEVQRLAGEAGAATDRIAKVLSGLEAKIDEAVTAVGKRSDAIEARREGERKPTLTGLMEQMARRVGEQDQEVTVVARDIEKIVGEAQLQSEAASGLKTVAAQAREGSDELIVSLGVFRIPAHLRPRALIAALAEENAVRGMNRTQQETALARVVASHAFVELLYITDARGVQVTRNVAAGNFQAAYGSTGAGRDWSDRPWFREPVRTGALYTSDIYRSAASDRFCFTVSAPLYGDDDVLVGVLGADIDLSGLL